MGEREWLRLTSAEGEVEFEVTTRALKSFLRPGSAILDIGGGPGRYAIWLAGQGHTVTLADLSGELLEIARTKINEAGLTEKFSDIVEADATDLSRWPDASFNAVLSLGPFYHLPDASDREKAASEIVRVLKPGGLAFVAFMPVYTFLRRTLALPDERHHLTQPGWLNQLLENGHFTNEVPGRFNQGFGVHPFDIFPFFQRFGLTGLNLLGTDGIAAGLQDTLLDLKTADPTTYQAALDLVFQTAGDPSILGMSGHLLYTGHKAES